MSKSTAQSRPQESFSKLEKEYSMKPKGKQQNTAIRVSSSAIKMQARHANPEYVGAVSSGKIEAVVKVASFSRGCRVKAQLEYVSRAEEEGEEVELEGSDGRTYTGKDAVNDLYEDWKEDFERAKPDSKRPPRDATHIVFSAGAENTPENLLKVKEAAMNTAKELIGDKGYDFVVGLHQDAKNPHVHIIVKNKSRELDVNKFRTNKPELFEFRQKFAEQLTKQKLEHVATLKRDRPAHTKTIQREMTDGIKRLEKKETQFQRAMRRAAPNKDALAHRRQMSASIVKLRESVKEKTAKGSEERLKLMGSVRKLERSIIKKDVDLPKQIESTVRSFGKDVGTYRKDLNTLSSPKRESEKLSGAEIETKKQFLDKEKKGLSGRIEETKKFIEKAPVERSVKDDCLQTVKLYKNMMEGKTVDLDAYREINQFKSDVDAYREKRKRLEDKMKAPGTKQVEKLSLRGEIKALDKDIEGKKKQVEKTINKSKMSPSLKSEAMKSIKALDKSIPKDRSRQTVS